jgi:hypothetical protein
MALHKLLTSGDVFGVKKAYELVNYIDRLGVDDRFVSAALDGKHISIHGASKTGKSSLIEKHLPDQQKLYVQCTNRMSYASFMDELLNAAFGRSQTEIINETEVGKGIVSDIGISLNAGKIIARSERNFEKIERTVIRHIDNKEYKLENIGDAVRLFADLGYGRSQSDDRIFIVIDDFHRLPEDVQQDIAALSKMLFDNANVVFIVIGIWAEENKLSSLCTELMGRCVDINCNIWPKERLVEVIENGERYLNIRFPRGFGNLVAHGARGSVFIVQEVCAEACHLCGITGFQEQIFLIDQTINGSEILKSIIENNCSFTDMHNKLLSIDDQDLHCLFPYYIMVSESPLKRVSQSKMNSLIIDKFPNLEFPSHFSYNACLAFENLIRQKNIGKIFDFYKDSANIGYFELIDDTFFFWIKGRRAQFLNDIQEKIEKVMFNHKNLLGIRVKT